MSFCKHPIPRLVGLVALALIALELSLAAMALAGPQDRFNDAWGEFHRLTKDKSRNKFRAPWKNVERMFLDIYKANPDGPVAPKALYYVGRTNEELARRSFLNSDFFLAVDYYQRMATRFPTHSWSDDCLLRKAEIELRNLNDPVQAEEDLLLLLRLYPEGDMAPQAEDLLREISGQTAEDRSAGGVSPQPADSFEPRQLLDIRHRSSDDYTRVVLDLDRETAYRYQILEPEPRESKPHRIYLDLENTLLGSTVAPEVHISDGILKRIRSGQNTPVVTRVVLDLLELKKFHIFALENPYRIVIDISSNGKQEPRKPESSAAAASLAPDPETFELPEGSRQQAGNLVEQLGLTIETIMLDPGHGGKDPGAMTKGGAKEKDVNLRFALMLGKELQGLGFKVLYTRTRDEFVPLEERTAMANVQNADLFISIHCNAHKQEKIHGLETYYLNLAKTEDAVGVAARENSVSTKRISDLQFILTDLMLNSKMRESKDLAENVQTSTVSALKKNYPVTDHGVRTAPFYVLMGAKMPSILVEIGYLTNKEEAKRLGNETYLQRKAKGLAEGISKYKEQIERFASL